MKEIKGLKRQRGWTTIIGYIVEAVVAYAVGYAINAIFYRGKHDPRVISPKFQDNQEFIRSAVEPHKLIYGQSLVSGPLAFAATNGTNNQSLHIVVPLAGHECEEIGTVYFDDISSAATEFNKIEVWRLIPYAQRAERQFHAVFTINGIGFAGATTQAWRGNHSRLNMARDVAFGLHRSITESTGYASRNYTSSFDYASATVTITGKTLGDEIEVVEQHIGSGGFYYNVWYTAGGLASPVFSATIGGNAEVYANDAYSQLVIKAHIFDISKHLGSPNQLADSSLVAENVGWTENHRLRGRAYVYLVLQYYADRWPTGIPVIKAEVKGKKVYDPRSGLTVWTDNAALCIRDYLLSVVGLNARESEIGTSFVSAANISDEYVLSATPVVISESEVSITGTSATRINVSSSTGGSLGHNLRTGDSVLISGHTGSTPNINGVRTVTVIDDDTVTIPVDLFVAGSGGTIQLRQRRYRCNGVITLGERPIDVVQRLLTCCDGLLVYTEGKYELFAGAYSSPVGDLGESDLRGGIRVTAKPPRQQLFNSVRGTFVDKQRSWQETDFPAYKNSTYITQDGGEEIVRDISLPFTTDSFAAQRLAKQMLERARQGIIVQFPAKLTAFKYQVNDVVRLSIGHFGWSSKEFRVLMWSLSDDLGINLTLQEESSAAYSWNNGDETNADSAPDTNLPSAFDVGSPQYVTAAEELYQGMNTAGFRSRISIAWQVADDTNVIGYVVYWRAFADYADQAPSNNWHDGHSSIVNDVEYALEDVPIGIFFIRVRSINNLGFYSESQEEIEVTVLGKTAPPGNVTGFAVGQNGDVVVFTWSPVVDIDLQGYEVRYGPIGATWDQSIVITQAERGTEVTSAIVPPGEWSFCIKAQDTSGIYSTLETCRVLEIAQSRTIVETSIEDPDFLGVLSNFVHHWTGALVPDSQDLASVDSWDTFDIFVPNPYATCYYVPKNDIDIGFVDDVRVWSDINATLGPGETTGSPMPFTEIDYHEGTEFDGYELWTIGLVRARYVRLRLGLTTASGICYISRYRANVDVAEQTDSNSNVVIPASGLAILFNVNFYSTPSIQITVSGGAALIATYTNASVTGFTAHVYNTSGTEVGGTINWTATGV